MGFSRDVALIARHFRRQRNQYMEEFRLKGCHFRYLVDVCQSPGITQDGLTRLLGVDKSNVARQVAILEEAGYLRRQADPEDKRALRLYPTEKAQAMLPQLRQVTAGWEADMLQHLTKEEQTQLTALLHKLWQRMEETTL